MKNLSIAIDPCDKFTTVKRERIMEACGFLPQWVYCAPDSELLMDTFKREYVYGIYEMNRCTLNDDGSFDYPGDPTQYPLIKMNKNKEVFYQYQSAFVAIVDKDKNVFFTRMD